MAESISISSTSITIDDFEFKELTRELIENSITSESSPFQYMKELLREELDSATDLDSNQRAGIYAGFLKESYSDINKQAMNTALDLLKSNKQLELERYQTEINYNKVLQDIENAAEAKYSILKDNILKDKEAELYDLKKAWQEYQSLEIRAKLQKQYGVTNSVTMVVGGAGELFSPVTLENGAIEWYKTTSNGSYLATEEEVNRVNTENSDWNNANLRPESYADDTLTADDADELNEWYPDQDPAFAEDDDSQTAVDLNVSWNAANEKPTDYEVGIMTTTDYTVAQKGAVSSTTIGSELINTTNPGAIDKQIVGYDKVNEKDALKTINELQSMLANAQVPCMPDWLTEATKGLLKKIVDNDSSVSMATIINDNDGLVNGGQSASDCS